MPRNGLATEDNSYFKLLTALWKPHLTFDTNSLGNITIFLYETPSKKQQVPQTVTQINSDILTWSNVNDFLNNCILSLFILFPVLYILLIDGTQFAVNKTRVSRSCDALPSPTVPNFGLLIWVYSKCPQLFLTARFSTKTTKQLTNNSATPRQPQD